MRTYTDTAIRGTVLLSLGVLGLAGCDRRASGGHLDTGSIGAGQSARYMVSAKGTYAYMCTFHPNMKAMLVVP